MWEGPGVGLLTKDAPVLMPRKRWRGVAGGAEQAGAHLRGEARMRPSAATLPDPLCPGGHPLPMQAPALIPCRLAPPHKDSLGIEAEAVSPASTPATAEKAQMAGWRWGWGNVFCGP